MSLVAPFVSFLSPSAAAPLMPFDVDLTPTPLADFLVGEDLVAKLLVRLGLHVAGVCDLLSDLRDEALDLLDLLLGGVERVFLLVGIRRCLLLLQVLDALLEDADGVFGAGDGRVELEVESQGDSDLVVGLGDAARVVGEVLLVAAQAGLQVLDGLRVVLVLDGDFSELHEGLAEPALDLGPLGVVGGERVRLLLEALLGQLEHLPRQLQARRVVVVLSLHGRLVLGLLGSAWPGVVGADGLVLAALGLSFGLLVLAIFSLGLLFLLALLSLGGGLLAAGFLALVLSGAVLARLILLGLVCVALLGLVVALLLVIGLGLVLRLPFGGILLEQVRGGLLLLGLFVHLLDGLANLIGHILLLLLGHLLGVLDAGALLVIALGHSAEAVLEDAVLHPGHLEESLAVVEERLAALGRSLPVQLAHHLAGLGEGADGAGDVVDEEVALAGRQVAHRLLQLQLVFCGLLAGLGE